MKYFLILVVFVLTSCAGSVRGRGVGGQIVENTKIEYTKTAISCRPLFFGNPSVAKMANKAGMKEVVSMEDDNYLLFSCVTVYGN